MKQCNCCGGGCEWSDEVYSEAEKIFLGNIGDLKNLVCEECFKKGIHDFLSI